MAQPESLYHAEMVNADGIEGKAYVKNGQLSVAVSSPLSEKEGTNPEQLLGLSFSTCLNATIESLLKGRGLENSSQVEVHVDFVREASGVGYFFEVLALARISDMTLERAEKIVTEAEKRCPVSKLLSGSSTVSVKTVESFCEN